MAIIDLNEVTGQGTVHNLAGKPRGESARKHFQLDRLDRTDEAVIVRAPDYLTNVSSSYFLGLFSPSIERLGVDGFLSKYRFEAQPHILRAIQHGIERSTMSRSPLKVA